MELAAVINGRIRRMSRGVNPSLVSWLTTMMGLRLQVVLEHMPVGPDAILRYVRRVGDPPQPLPEEPMEVQGSERTSPEPQRENASPAPGTTAEEAMSRGPPPAPEGAPETNRMELQPRQNLGRLQSPQNGSLLSSRTFRASGR